MGTLIKRNADRMTLAVDSQSFGTGYIKTTVLENKEQVEICLDVFGLTNRRNEKKSLELCSICMHCRRSDEKFVSKQRNLHH